MTLRKAAVATLAITFPVWAVPLLVIALAIAAVAYLATFCWEMATEVLEMFG